jgi:hypothetical protein
MLQRELLIVLSFVMMVFLGVAGTGWFAVQHLNQTSRKLALDTLPGLVEAGLAEERIYESRRVMREILFPHTVAERRVMVDFVQTNTANEEWQSYSTSIFEPEDQHNYETMMLARSNYLQTMPRFFDLVKAGNIDQATAYFYGGQDSLFRSYLAAVKSIFEYNVAQGRVRGQSILTATRYAPWAIGALCVVVFVFGLALGLRMALRGKV